MPKAEITSYSVLDLLSWHESGALAISPKFQRRSVWTAPARGHFIDSILLDFPIPPIHVRLADSGGRTVREVVDGQQRMRAVFDFIAGAYRISPSASSQWGGKTYKQLSDAERDQVRLFSFTVYQYKKITDAEVLDIFSRLNTYSVGLSAQELRNGRWFGAFKRQSYSLATESLEFWRRHRIFTEQQIARMREAELTSELLVAILDGLQDKKASLDSFYENLNEVWSRRTTQWHVVTGRSTRLQPCNYLSAVDARNRFRETLGTIDAVLGEVLVTSPLRRPALFYTLFCATYHLQYGLPRSDRLPLAGVGVKGRVADAMRYVTSELTEAFERDVVARPKELALFVGASSQQTDNLLPRQQRLTSLIRLIRAAI